MTLSNGNATRREADRLAQLGEAAFQAGNPAATLTHYRAALALHERLVPDGVEVAWCLDRIAAAQFRLGDHPAAVNTLVRAVALRRRLDMPRHLIEALISLGLARAGAGDSDAAEADLEEAWVLTERVMPGSVAEGIVLGHLGSLMLARPDFERARRYLDRSHRVLAAIDPASRDTAIAIGRLGVLARNLGDHAEAIRLQGQALAIARAQRWPKDVADILTNLGRALYDDGQHDRAFAALSEAHGIYQRTAPGASNHGLCLYVLGMLLTSRGERTRGADLLRGAARILGPGMAALP